MPRFDNQRFLVHVFLILASGCQQAASSGTPGGSSVDTSKGSIQVVHPEKRQMFQTLEQPGQVQAFEKAPLFAKIAGFVSKVHVDIGDRVRGPLLDNQGQVLEKGQILANIAVPELVEEVRQKELLIRQAQAEAEQARETINVAQANLEYAAAAIREAEAGRARVAADRERWEKEYARIHPLVARGILDEQTRDETRNQLESSRSAVKEMEARVELATASSKESAARLEKVRADLRAAEARMAVAEADYRRVAVLLEYTTIRAPFDGIVTMRHVDPGHYVTAPTGSSQNQFLFMVARLDPVRVVFDVPEGIAPFIQKGFAARVHIQGLKEREFEGRVARSAWRLESATRTLRMEIDLPNPSNTGHLLRPGMYAYARLRVPHGECWTLPAAAITMRDDRACCFLVEGGKAVLTPLKLGLRNGIHVEVLRRLQVPAIAGAEPEWREFNGSEVVVLTNPGDLKGGQVLDLVAVGN